MADNHPKTILLVEDEAIIAMAEAQAIQKFGYRVLTALNGEQAIALAARGEPIDLILMDIDLGPGMDGTQAAREILGQRAVPIIFLTAHAEREMVEKVRHITRYGYVIKNSGGFVLQSSIEMAFELFEAHQQTRQSELKYRTVADFTHDWEYWRGPDGQFVYVSPACQRITGYSPQAFINDPDLMMTIIYPDDRELFRRHLEHPLAPEKGTGSSLEFRIITCSGEVCWINHACQPVFSPEGQYLGNRGSNRDITQQKQAEDERRYLEEKFHKAFHISPDAININRLIDGMYMDINQGFTDLTGYTAEETIGKTSLELNIWDDPQDRARLVQGLRERGEVLNLEARFRFKDGRIRIGLMSARLIEVKGEAHILSVTRDITERNREATAARERDVLYRQMFTEHSAIMLLLDPETGRIVDANQAAQAFYGYPLETLCQMTIEQINMLPPEQSAAIRRQVCNQDYNHFTIRHHLASGEERVVEVYSAPIQHQGQVLLYSIIHDISGHNQADQGPNF